MPGCIFTRLIFIGPCSASRMSRMSKGLYRRNFMKITQEDEQQLHQRGMTLVDLHRQWEMFTHGAPALKLEKPCTVGDGIVQLSASECNRLVDVYEKNKGGKSIVGFVPASGAASRMFKHLHHYDAQNESDLTEEFILHFRKFPFLDQLREKMLTHGHSLDEAIEKDHWALIFQFILSEDGLNYDNQLKGMVAFHRYSDGVRTAFEEQLYEFMRYGKQADGRCKMHFTIAPQHMERVKGFMHQVINSMQYEDVEIDYSIQDAATDTIAMTKDNTPERDSRGRLVFRPGGHGALIRNLQSIDADLIFVKNIDNVTTESQADDTVFYKKILGGLLLELKQRINGYLDQMDAGASDELVEEALEFIHQWIQPGLPLGMTPEQRLQYVRLRLDRPLRVCGMVRNEGEPGGGPFWVKMPGGYLSKQIVEKSQVENGNVNQLKVFKSATHFNPVDIVCSIKNREGNNYPLDNFIDHEACFISEKFQHGHVIKALELPGLWNGAMALWNTLFVEVPNTTFNPVKTVNDLLRPGHQS